MRWDPEEPHLPSIAPEPFASLVEPDDVPPWPSFPDPLAGKPTIQRQQLRSWGIDGWPWERWAPVVARYLGVVALIDHQVGRILAALDELGLAERTLVVYTSDHGDLCGAHGMIDKHYVMYDDVVRVPLILRWPGRLPPGSTVDAFVTAALDLATTFCVAAGIEPPPTFAGHDLLALANGGAPTTREGLRQLSRQRNLARTASAWCARAGGSTSGMQPPRMNSITWRTIPASCTIWPPIARVPRCCTECAASLRRGWQ